VGIAHGNRLGTLCGIALNEYDLDRQKELVSESLEYMKSGDIERMGEWIDVLAADTPDSSRTGE
jgi:hypothetical protein